MIDAASNIRMIGDPMEIAGKPYRQFLLERWCRTEVRDFPSTGLPFIVWVELQPYEGPCDGCRNRKRYRVTARRYPSVVCECQGRFLE